MSSKRQTPPGSASSKPQGSKAAPKTHNYGTEQEQDSKRMGQRSALLKRRRQRQAAQDRPPSGRVDGM